MIAKGGGAVYLAARNRITIDGVINVSGAGATPGSLLSGGSGGGSGGMIVLFAPQILGNGIVVANGGGGASGSNANTTGQRGLDPNPMQPTLAAPGGAPLGSGGGGMGSVGNSPGAAGGTGAFMEGGGGGGGSGGVIRANVAAPTLTASPPIAVVQ
jgi:hypothetical protein